MSRRFKLATILVTGTMLVAMTAGCGLHRVGPEVDPGEDPAPTPAPTASATPAPSPSPSPTATPAPKPVSDLTARVLSVTTSGILSRKAIATVEIVNPNTVAVTGKVTCTIGGKTPQTSAVSLQGGETKSVTFEQSVGLLTFHPDAQATVTTDKGTSTASMLGYR